MNNKYISFILAFLFIFSAAVPAYAERTSISETPRLMISDYSTEGTLKSGNTITLNVEIKNTGKSPVRNIKLSFSESSGTFLPKKTDSTYLASLGSNGKYLWTVPVKISEKAVGGSYPVTISCEYESKDGQSLASSGNITLSLPKTAEDNSLTQDTSQPRLIITSFDVKDGYISPDEVKTLTINIKNTSSDKNVTNIMLTMSDESGELRPEGTDTVFVPVIAAGDTFGWQISISAAHTAKTGKHKISIQMNYEDKYKTPFTCTDSFGVDVRQLTKLGYNGAQLPVKVTQGDSIGVTVSFMNIGKGIISNVTLEVSAENMQSSGMVLVGEIKPGETKSGTNNLRIDNSYTGESKGTIKISYEDEFGETYNEEIPVSTVIQKKITIAENESESESKNSLWWLFILTGIIIGGGIGAAIPIMIYSNKKRKADEELL